ncbi:MAG: MotA/TolQ/ExbB proton channel family protein [Acidaminococcus sp.]|uniref:MotA/TolQ/ExbB proton channel family protein n=1 Tax=Acidaminococcus sp. TaxID=1872103 RepID=UPI003F16D70D|nr:MotA/TolQ/ExbB proton channel family protein [Acidaminococcus sp.]
MKVFFSNPLNLIFIAAFLIAAYYAFKWLLYVRKVNGQLDQLNELLGSFTKESVLANYGNFLAQMKEAPFSGIWKRLERTLYPHNNEEILTTQDPADYYTETSILENVNLTAFKNMAATFTGLGLLGTFLGLTVGIAGIKTDSIENLKAGIAVLLEGTATAFWTSVAGLVLAIAFNIAYARLMRQYHTLVDSIVDQLTQLFPVKSLEEFLSLQVEQAQEQTDEMRTLNGDLVTQMGEMFQNLSANIDVALKNNLTASFTNTLTPVFQELNKSIDKLGSSAGDTLSQSIQEGAGNEIQGLAVTLNEFQGKMGNLMEVSERMNQENATRLQSAVELMVTKLNEAMDANIQKQASSNDANQEAMKNLVEEMNTNLRAALEQMVEAGKTANQALLQTTEATRGTIQEITSTMTASAKSQKEDMLLVTSNMKESVLDVLKQLQEDMQARNKTMDAYMATLDSLVNRNKQVMDSASLTADKFAKASTPMQKVADTLGNQLNLVIGASNKFSSSVDQNVQKLLYASENNNKDMVMVRDSLTTMKNTWQSYQDTFQGVSKEMRDATESLSHALQQYNESTSTWMTKTLTQYDKSIRDAMTNVSAINETLVDAIDELNETMGKQKKA